MYLTRVLISTDFDEYNNCLIVRLQAISGMYSVSSYRLFIGTKSVERDMLDDLAKELCEYVISIRMMSEGKDGH